MAETLIGCHGGVTIKVEWRWSVVVGGALSPGIVAGARTTSRSAAQARAAVDLPVMDSPLNKLHLRVTFLALLHYCCFVLSSFYALLAVFYEKFVADSTKCE